ncbi:hypothetical protein A3Q56_07598 [Intoshia linei]|uniref:Tc1-like transposase DDE domain-containing protein n=1 Tax=Intoshia linei TaxID=1819745 RepID=A0A177ARN8_9BILA|nr:hypothetical protein A3Q56_07598 [Intoshia linei]
MEFARVNIGRNPGKICFSDEKRFCLDGHDVRNESLEKLKRQSRGGRFMGWNMISTNLLPHKERFDVFQQDNAPIYVSNSSKKFFMTKNVELLSWPPMSPDLVKLLYICVCTLLVLSCYEHSYLLLPNDVNLN